MRATKQITCIKHLTHAERLSYLNLPTLHYRRIRGDMIMVFKIVTGIMDSKLPESICTDKDTKSFKRNLKTHLFIATFN